MLAKASTCHIANPSLKLHMVSTASWRLSEVVVTVRSEVSPVGGSEGRMHIAAGQGVADDG
ncbi:hypothetical protein Tco_1160142, partial [Tanacetum coccineum]